MIESDITIIAIIVTGKWYLQTLPDELEHHYKIWNIYENKDLLN